MSTKSGTYTRTDKKQKLYAPLTLVRRGIKLYSTKSQIDGSNDINTFDNLVKSEEMESKITDQDLIIKDQQKQITSLKNQVTVLQNHMTHDETSKKQC